MNLYDRIIEMAILWGVLLGCWLEWQNLQEKRKTKILRMLSRAWTKVTNREKV